MTEVRESAGTAVGGFGVGMRGPAVPPAIDAKDIQFVRWPTESVRREHLRSLGVSRLLIVERGSTPPECCDILEDWVRPPVPREDLRARVDTLRRRARIHHPPRIDQDGVLHRGRLSVAVSPAEADLLDLLIANFGSLVPREELRTRLSARNTPASRNALDLHIKRIRRRISPLGLAIHTAWRRGYLLGFENPSDAR